MSVPTNHRELKSKQLLESLPYGLTKPGEPTSFRRFPPWEATQERVPFCDATLASTRRTMLNGIVNGADASPRKC
jgi:hypothetical protein